MKEIGNKLFGQNKFHEAIDHYGKAIELQPQNAILFANRSMAHLKLEHFREALIDATVAIDIDPKSVKAFHRRAIAHQALGHFSEALQDATTCLQLDPSSAPFKDLVSKLQRSVTSMTRPSTSTLTAALTSAIPETLVSRLRQPTSSPTEKKSSVKQQQQRQEIGRPQIMDFEPTTASSSSSPFLLSPDPDPLPIIRPALANVKPVMVSVRRDLKSIVPTSLTSFGHFEPLWIEINELGDLDAMQLLWGRLQGHQFADFFGDMMSTEMLTSFVRSMDFARANGRLTPAQIKSMAEQVSRCPRISMLCMFLPQVDRELWSQCLSS